MKTAVVASFARTPLCKSYRGAFNDTHGARLAGHVIEAAVSRAGIDGDDVEDVLLGCAMQEGTTGYNISRQAAIRAGLPVHTSAATINRFCASGLQSIASVAADIVCGQTRVGIAGGVESISLVQTEHKNVHRREDDWIVANKPAIYMPMLQTAEIVASRYGISREYQDAFALESQQRAATAQAEGRFDQEIAPLTVDRVLVDRETGERSYETVHADRDEGIRPDTTAAGLSRLRPVLDSQGTVTAGNASQLSDGAAACVIMDADLAEHRGIEPLGIFRGFAVVGCEPDEMGIGPVVAVPRLLSRFGLEIDDIDLWELNEAFASQALYCRDRLGIDPSCINVDGGAIALGHPYGVSGTRIAGHALVEGARRKARRIVVTLCVGAGMGAAGLFEIA